MIVRSTATRNARLLHTTASNTARLINSRMSVEPGSINQLPPAAPPVVQLTNKGLNAPIRLPERLSKPTKIEQTLVRAVHQIDSSSFDSIPAMLRQLSNHNGKALSVPLQYEPTPSDSRRIRVPDVSDPTASGHPGIVSIAHVYGSHVVFSTGFVIGTSDRPIVATCSHVLQSFTDRVNKHSSPPPPSAAFVVTPNMLYPIPKLIASLSTSDLLLFEGPRAANLQTVPVSPYPAPAGSAISAPLASPEGRRWATGHIVEYKDGMGRAAETGTYDELATLTIDLIPTPGSSGAPLVDSNGAVVGLIRGSTNSYGDRMSRGSVTPAEKIFELFALPGFKPKSQQEAEAAASTPEKTD